MVKTQSTNDKKSQTKKNKKQEKEEKQVEKESKKRKSSISTNTIDLNEETIFEEKELLFQWLDRVIKKMGYLEGYHSNNEKVAEFKIFSIKNIYELNVQISSIDTEPVENDFKIFCQRLDKAVQNGKPIPLSQFKKMTFMKLPRYPKEEYSLTEPDFIAKSLDLIFPIRMLNVDNKQRVVSISTFVPPRSTVVEKKIKTTEPVTSVNQNVSIDEEPKNELELCKKKLQLLANLASYVIQANETTIKEIQKFIDPQNQKSAEMIVE